MEWKEFEAELRKSRKYRLLELLSTPIYLLEKRKLKKMVSGRSETSYDVV